MAEYVSTINDPKMRKILTKFRLSAHELAIQNTCLRQTRLPREGYAPYAHKERKRIIYCYIIIGTKKSVQFSSLYVLIFFFYCYYHMFYYLHCSMSIVFIYHISLYCVSFVLLWQYCYTVRPIKLV